VLAETRPHLVAGPTRGPFATLGGRYKHGFDTRSRQAVVEAEIGRLSVTLSGTRDGQLTVGNRRLALVRRIGRGTAYEGSLNGGHRRTHLGCRLEKATGRAVRGPPGGIGLSVRGHHAKPRGRVPGEGEVVSRSRSMSWILSDRRGWARTSQPMARVFRLTRRLRKDQDSAGEFAGYPSDVGDPTATFSPTADPVVREVWLATGPWAAASAGGTWEGRGRAFRRGSGARHVRERTVRSWPNSTRRSLRMLAQRRGGRLG